MNNISDIARLLAETQDRYRLFTLPPTARLLQELHPLKLAGFQEMVNQLAGRQVAMEAVTQGLTQRLAQINASMQAITANVMPNWDMLRVTPWADLMGPNSPLERFNVQISNIGQAYSLINARLQSIACLPSIAAAEHFTQTARLVESWNKQGKSTDALAISVAAAEGESAVQQVDIVEYPTIVEIEDELGDESCELGDQPTLNLFEVQRNELIYIARRFPALLHDEQILNKTATTDYFNTAQSVCRLIILINRQRVARGEDSIFKLTNRLVESLIVLPNLIANSRQLFGEFIDCLYFALYEGAGKDSLRFLGLIGDDGAAPVWAVKHFRNYDLRHDIDHGKPREITKKSEALTADYRSLIGVSLPRKRRDFRNAQLVLLKQIEAMLRRISDAIEALPAPSAGTTD